MVEILGIDFRNRQAVTAKMPGEFQKSDVLFAHVIEDADGADLAGVEADDAASGATELALQRLDVLDRRAEVLFEEVLEDVHAITLMQRQHS